MQNIYQQKKNRALNTDYKKTSKKSILVPHAHLVRLHVCVKYRGMCGYLEFDADSRFGN